MKIIIIYDVKGKTKVKDNICPFTGTIKIKKAYHNYNNYPKPRNFRRGSVICSCLFYEDSNANFSGQISGTLVTDWCINVNKIYYDNIDMVSDGYCNNQFTGTWKNYKGTITKICNYGDYRIPHCKDLDLGVGEFSVNEKYLMFGWQNIGNLFVGDTILQRKAMELELKKWWE